MPLIFYAIPHLTRFLSHKSVGSLARKGHCRLLGEAGLFTQNIAYYAHKPPLSPSASL